MTAEEEGMDLLDFVNRRVFGNAAFRHQQRKVIEAVLEVGLSVTGGSAYRSVLVKCAYLAPSHHGH